MVITLLFGVASGFAGAPAAWLTMLLIDRLTDPQGQSAVTAAALASGALFLSAVGVTAAYASGIAGSRLAAAVRIETESRLALACAAHVGTAFLDDPDEQDRLRLAQRGAHDAPPLVTSSAVEFVSSGASIGGYVVVLLASWPAMLLLLVVVAVPIAFIQRRMGQRAVAVAECTSASFRWTDYFSQLFGDPVSARDMRLYGAERLFARLLRRHLVSALEREVRQEVRASYAQIGFSLLNAALAAGGSAYVAVAAFRGHISVGEFVLFSTAVAAVQARLTGMLELSARIRIALGAFHHYVRFVREVPGSQTGEPAPPLSTGLAFEDVWFRYGPEQPWILRGVSFTIDAGETCGLVGRNGAGKSTVVKLMLRFYEPTQGRILWNGRDVRELDALSLRRRTAGVLQDAVPYELTAVENITLGDLDHYGDVTVGRRAAEQAGVLARLERLPAGLETMLSTRRADADGERGLALSGGEWQRVALARALARESADLLILDEPNAGLDAEAEHDLHVRIMGLGVDRTRLLISHRLSAVRAAGHIVVLDGGRVVEQGSHEDLLETPYLYAHLFNLQAGPYAGSGLR